MGFSKVVIFSAASVMLIFFIIFYSAMFCCKKKKRRKQKNVKAIRQVIEMESRPQEGGGTSGLGLLNDSTGKPTL